MLDKCWVQSRGYINEMYSIVFDPSYVQSKESQFNECQFVRKLYILEKH